MTEQLTHTYTRTHTHYSPWHPKELDTTEPLTYTHTHTHTHTHTTTHGVPKRHD